MTETRGRLGEQELDHRPGERIALVTSSMGGGGAQRAVARLATALAERGYPVDLVLARAAGPYLAEVSSDVRVVDLHAPRLAQALVPLARYFRSQRPAAVFSALDYVNVVAILARALARVDTRLVVSERNTLSQAVAHTRSARTRLMPRLISWTYPRADAVVAVSPGVADDLLAVCRLAPSTVHVLNNPVVTPQLEARRSEPVEHPWLRDRTAPVALAVGRLTEQKDFRTLLEAFALVLQRQPAARLVILGEGSLRAELEGLARTLAISDSVSMPGFSANPYPAMAAADVFVLSSRWEGSPGALIEAVACGTAAVATDCPSGPAQVLDDGRYGRLVPVGDANAMAEALDDALAGRVDRPPPESWHPYEQGRVVDSYLDLLLPGRAT